MTSARVDVIIAIHDATRPIRRAVQSVLSTRGVDLQVIVVCHEIGASAVNQALDGLGDDSRVTLLEFSDGIRSPAGPFNRGLDEASAEYVCVMGSDDFLEPGALDAWVKHVDTEKPAAALVRLRHQNGRRLHNPLARPGRTRRLSAVKDRLFYRTAPLGLLRQDVIDELGLRFREGLRSGDDLEFGVRLWSSGRRIDYLRHAPCYVIGDDAKTRVSTEPMPVEEAFAAVDLLVQEPFVSELAPDVRRSLAIKLVRIHVLGDVMRRRTAAAWGDDEVERARRTLLAVLSLATDVLGPFSRADRRVLDTLAETGNTASDVVAVVATALSAGLADRNLTRELAQSFSRESTLRRYAVYRFSQ